MKILKFALALMVSVMGLSSCKKEASTGSSTSSTASTNTTATTATTATTGAGTNTLTVDGVSWSNVTTGCEVTPYNYVFYTGPAGTCQVIFDEAPTSGNYTTNGSTPLSGAQCKINLFPPQSSNVLISVDGGSVAVTSSGGKTRVVFNNIVCKQDPLSGTDSKTATGNFGCD